MTTNKESYQETENQDITMDDGFTADPGTTGSDSPECDNMADAGDNASLDEAAMWKDKYMRLSAEYENYRKRTAKEKLDIIAAGGEDVVRSMLEVLDDMDRALLAMADTDDMQAVKQGIALIDNKLRGTLKSRGLAEIEATGSLLDTDLHEAIARIEVEQSDMKGRIIDVVQKGYKLKDKIIRYAKVVVGQ